MFLILTLPLAWQTFQFFKVATEAQEAAKTEASGAPVIGHLLRVIASTQLHRGLVNRSLAGDASVAAKLQVQKVTLKDDLLKLDASLTAMKFAEITAAWQPTREALLGLADGKLAPDARASFKLHTDLIASTRALVGLTAEDSGLLLDPEAVTFHLMHLAVESIVPWTESLARIRGQSSGYLLKRAATTAERADLLVRAQQFDDASAFAERVVAALARAGDPVPAGFVEALSKGRAYLQQTRELVSAETIAGDADANFAQGSAAITAATNMGVAVTDRLVLLLDARVATLGRQLEISMLVCTVSVLVGAYLALAFLMTSYSAVINLLQGVRSLGAGDFNHAISSPGKDELSDASRTLESMTGHLSTLIADVRTNSAMVAQAGLSLGCDIKLLAERTEAQAASIEQTAASIKEITTGVRRGATAAQTADTMASQVRGKAEAGGAAIGAIVASMDDIRQSSAKVQSIVSDIEGLAFQTNLLALNAAVEAARAGEQGRGFAVVATEVRSLDQRSAQSAREISQLIGASVQSVRSGASQVESASTTFDEIVKGIREVATSVADVRVSTTQQSASLEEVFQAIHHIDEITQKNARMAEVARSNSTLLSNRAARMAEGVAALKLRQGCADEAVALVARATELLKAGGSSALAAITGRGQDFADRDMYVFVLDRRGVYKSFAGNPAKVGSSVRDNPGVDGERLVREGFEVAAQGGGWVDYDYLNPQTGKVDAKTTYFVPLGRELIVGCGIYELLAAALDARLVERAA